MRKAIALLPLIVSLLLPYIAMAAPGSTDNQTAKLLAQVRQATDKYHDANVALADGYVPASPCEDEMGIHYVNSIDEAGNPTGLVVDMVVTELQPEILLYVPTDEGMKLVGVEYFMVAIGHNSTYAGPLWEMTMPAGWVWDIPAPSLFGHPMDGPMAPHGPGMPWHFDFHVYIWQANPDGIFEEWNPTVKC